MKSLENIRAAWNKSRLGIVGETRSVLDFVISGKQRIH